MSAAPRRIGIDADLLWATSVQIWQGIRQYATEHPLWNLEIIFQTLTNLSSYDGLLVYLHGVDSLARHIHRARRPAVNLTPHEEPYRIPQVIPDHYADGRAVAEHLLACRLKHFAYCGYDPSFSFSALRQQGFQDTLARAGQSAKALSLVMMRLDSVSSMRRLSNWLTALPKPVGVMAATDFLGRRVLSLVAQLGFRVPQDVSLVAVDNLIPICEDLQPQMTSVPHDQNRIGYEAAKLLDALMAGQPPPRKPLRIAPLPIVVRHSSDSLAVNDPVVIQAVKLIRAQAHTPIALKELMPHLSISRRSLELRFRRHLGHTIHEEIWQAHAERAKKLLAQTSWTVSKVAEHSGFASPEHLYQVFKKRVGRTPGRYRRQFQLGS